MSVSKAKTSNVIYKTASNSEIELWQNKEHWRQERYRQQKAADIERIINAKVEQAFRLLR